jgi:hypothetical protein
MIQRVKRLLYNLYLLFPYAFGRRKKYFSGEEKNIIHKFRDLVSWLLRDDQFNHNYYAFGLNLRYSMQNEFIGRKEFLEIKYKAEYQIKNAGGFNDLMYGVVSKDKFVANALLVANNIPCVPVLGLISGTQIFYTNGNTKTIDDLLCFKEPFVLKNVILEYGDGFMLCKTQNDKIYTGGVVLDLNGIRQRLGNGKWIVQKKYESHEAIRNVNKTALNTTRVVTILSGKDPVYLTGFQSFATGDAENDNWGNGSIYVGFNYRRSVLKAHGFYHPAIEQQAIVETHPDSAVKFEGYFIPFLNESVELCLAAHRLYYNNFIIGWDAVITDRGPLILEANEKPGMNAVQCIDGGLRYKIKECYTNTINYIRSQS